MRVLFGTLETLSSLTDLPQPVQELDAGGLSPPVGKQARIPNCEVEPDDFQPRDADLYAFQYVERRRRRHSV